VYSSFPGKRRADGLDEERSPLPILNWMGKGEERGRLINLFFSFGRGKKKKVEGKG